jgi:hypothetical protein
MQCKVRNNYTNFFISTLYCYNVEAAAPASRTIKSIANEFSKIFHVIYFVFTHFLEYFFGLHVRVFRIFDNLLVGSSTYFVANLK